MLTSSVTENKYRILIADDDPDILFYLETLFESEGYKVILAHNGTEALNLTLAHNPDLIVLDRMMPEITGDQVCYYLKSDLNTSSIPIIILTALENTKDIVEGLNLGANAYIVKPFKNNELLAYTNAMLKQSDIYKQITEKEKLMTLRNIVVSFNHEINNPLTTILLCAQLINTYTSNEEIIKNTEFIIKSTGLIKEFLEKVRKTTKVSSTTYLGRETMLDLT